MSEEKPYIGPTITHQGIRYLPHPYKRGDIITRCWSKWTDGSVTHSDTATEWHDVGGYKMSFIVHVGIISTAIPPPPDLEWVDTRQIRSSG